MITQTAWVRLSIFAFILMNGCMAGEPVSKDSVRESDKKESVKLPKNGFTYRLAEDHPEKVKGYKVSLQVLKDEAKESYFIHLYAAVNNPEQKGTFKKVRLGETSIFKPLKQGDVVSVYIDTPEKKAIREDGEIWICWEIAAARPERELPKVELKVIGVEPRPKQ